MGIENSETSLINGENENARRIFAITDSEIFYDKNRNTKEIESTLVETYVCLTEN